ncbi:MAG TPA: PAS domain S-box protein [Syntrophaceae bacterium]|nr:PAS domain S-box protein [Syntrophaceae bacterium]
MHWIIDYVRRRLRMKIALVTISTVAVLMGAIIYLSITAHTKGILKTATHFGEGLAENTYSAIKYPMEIGDSKTIAQQLREIKAHMEDVEVYICDFDREITYASSEDVLRTRVSSDIIGEGSLPSVIEMLATGESPKGAFLEKIQNRNYLVTLRPILNERACYHCHGSSRKVLGGLIVKQCVDESYAAIASSRNRDLFLGLLGIGAILFILQFAMSKLVTERIRNLDEKASQVAKGDTTVSVKVKSGDSIGRLAGHFNEMIKSINDRMEYANSLKLGISEPFFMMDHNLTVTYMNDAISKICGYSKEEVEGKMKCIEVFKADICDTACAVKKALATGEPTVGVKANIISSEGETIPIIVSSAALKDSTGKILGAFELMRDISSEVEAERVLKESAAREEEHRKYLEDRVSQFFSILDRASQGNLSLKAEVLGKKDIMDRLAIKINETFEKIGELIAQTKKAARNVAHSSNQIFSGNQDLSQRTQQQAAALEETSTTLEQMTASVNQNAENTLKADKLAKETVELVEEGGIVVKNTTESMEQITEASKHIEEIISMVNDIAFQTNLLSLNAAVEAARAGEHGRGFAVVANEVRTLARRSADAAKDIQSLIKNSLNRVEKGHRLVEQTGESLNKIREHIKLVSEAISEISIATQEQSKGIDQTNQSIMEMDGAVQQNAKLVAELAESSQDLAREAELLEKLTEEFIIYPLETQEAASSGSSKERRGALPPTRRSLAEDMIHKGPFREPSEEEVNFEEDKDFEEF